MKGAEFSKMVVAYGESGKSVALAFGPQEKILTSKKCILSEWSSQKLQMPLNGQQHFYQAHLQWNTRETSSWNLDF